MTTKREKIMVCFLATLRCAKHSLSVQLSSAIIANGLCFGLIAVSFIFNQVGAADNDAQLSSQSRSSLECKVAAVVSPIETKPVVAPQPKRAKFEQEHASPDAQNVADWVVNSGDNQGMTFVIVDKKDAKVFVFYADGRLRGAAPALLGLAVGDEAIPGIGNKEMSTIRPEERTTPAGRFVSAMGRNFYGKDILWVDYEGAVSLHRVATNKPAERRLERLATPTPLDNRISYGCINVPAKFFDNVVKPAFLGTKGIVYVLPEVRSKKEIFPSYFDVESVGELAQMLPSTRE